jgi:hypothetical protein
MAMVLATPEPVIDDDVFEEVDKFEKQGDLTEERHEILEKLSMEEIAAEILQGQAEHPERYSTPERIRAKAEQLEEPHQTAKRRVKMVSA